MKARRTIAAYAGEDAGHAPILAHDLFGTGPEPVLVLHSWMGTGRSFDAMKPYLDTDAFTYAFADLRGYGGSRTIAGEYTAAEVAGDALVLADHLGWQRFHLVGHSMSGLAVQRLLVDDISRAAPRIKRAVGITPVTADGFPADAQMRAFLRDLIHRPDLTAQGIAAMTGQRLSARWIGAIAARNIESSDPAAMRGYYRMWLDADFGAQVAQARPATPLLVIGGRRDLEGFSEARYRATLARWFPNLELRFIDDAGHFPMYETPIYLATLIEAHLRRTDPDPVQLERMIET
ncbi:MAG: alpha/beta fold hydrolase [Gammaproteobacteria bacterium]